MGLRDDVETRVPAQHLIRMTNIDDTTATAINGDVLDAAVADAEGDILTWCATEYDSSDRRMVPVGVMGVLNKLRTWAAGEAIPDAVIAETEEYRRRLQALAKVTGRDRITPESTSNYDPSPEPHGRPAFDDSAFDGVL
jgi:hypothetical protein